MYLQPVFCTVGKNAVFPIAYLIWSYLQTNHNLGCVEIHRDKILFTKHVFFTVGKISYEPYGLVCKDNVIYCDGKNNFPHPHDGLFTFLVNALLQLRDGYMIPFPK